ncbi:hypothetical protein PPERSA_07997 [Pseudocohnilembus persalinus]|uniref:Transmembrane protein n=1 Tax=Pseudocohnilembus persalinus TaxID=266149 RepID=A0A0V0R2C9_PSEPJ|nr:hypothetical protein PPERSA_07997 [Pseudocohnilembus persalinus]|eukprot:KRX08686.1 hypothetical protein PPERSA_07997 [Pseudocohnilembus persalinus]
MEEENLNQQGVIFDQTRQEEEIFNIRKKHNIYYKDNEIQDYDKRNEIRRSDIRKNVELANIILTILLSANFLYILKNFYRKEEVEGEPFLQNQYAILLLIFVTYPLYLIECFFFSKVGKQIRNVLNYEQTMNILEKIRNSFPQVDLIVQTFKLKNSQENQNIEPENIVKIASIKETLKICQADDVSGEIEPSLEFCKCYKINFKFLAEPANSKESKKYQQIQDKIFEKLNQDNEQNKNDIYTLTRHNVKLPINAEGLLYCFDKNNSQELLSYKWFTIFSFLGLSLVHRLNTIVQIGYIDVLLKKRFYLES